MPTNRRFPPPWTVEELDACFVMRNAQWAEAGVQNGNLSG
jgi:hypothetical protein